MSKDKNRNRIPDPKDQVKAVEAKRGLSKYKFGDTSHKISDIKQLRPVFAFDYISLSGTNFCFNSNLIDAKKDYLKFLEGLKKLSSKTYDELSKDRAYHFHEVDLRETTITISSFIKAITHSPSFDKDQCPTVYQFEIFGKSRIFGFIFDYAFYLVFWDKNHDAYSRKG